MTRLTALVIGTLLLTGCTSNAEYFSSTTPAAVQSAFDDAMKQACERHRVNHTLTPDWSKYCKDHNW